MDFPIIEVLPESSDFPEQLGTKEKFWFAREDGSRCLFKWSRENTGEHWSEKIACELGAQLGIPHAHYELAECAGRLGVITPTFVPPDGRLVLGNELFSSTKGSYGAEKKYHQTDHTVKLVMSWLRTSKVDLPATIPNDPRIKSADDAFVGYLLLDAWIGNTDRHHENWGICISVAEGVRLAPSFDHASCLGRIESEAKMQDVLTTKDKGRAIEAYVHRAKSALYADSSDKKPLSTLAAFTETIKMKPSAADYWLERLQHVSVQDVKQILDRVPNRAMSDVAKGFVLRMLQVNRDRIMSAWEQAKA